MRDFQTGFSCCLLALAGCVGVPGPLPVPTAAEAVTIPSALGGKWSLEAVGGKPMAAAAFRMQIEATGVVTGNVECNRFDGRLVGRFPVLTFDNVISTTVLCGDGSLSRRLSELFGPESRFTVSGARLTIVNESGTWTFLKS